MDLEEEVDSDCKNGACSIKRKLLCWFSSFGVLLPGHVAH